MTRIEKLAIEGYRGIDYFEYKPKMINILVGRNNTGKSSILESAAIISTAPADFRDRLGNNILEKIIERKGWKNLEYFININHRDKGIKLSGIIDGVEKQVNITSEWKHVREKINSESLHKLVINYLEEKYSIHRREIEASEIFNEPVLFIENSPDRGFFFAFSKLKTVLPHVRSSGNVVFYGSQFRELLNIKFLHDRLLPTAGLYQTLDYLRKHIPYFSDIRSDGEEIWIFFENLPQPLPLPMVGDGMREAIHLMFIASIIQGGVFLMEEPENNLHPGLYELVAQKLVEIAQQDKTQIFLSTHNLDFAEKLLRIGEDFVNVVRLYRVGNEIAYEVLEHGEALEELDELHIDLRGP